MSTPLTTDPVMRFMEALYPGNAHIALASFNEAKALNDAADELARLRGLLAQAYGLSQRLVLTPNGRKIAEITGEFAPPEPADDVGDKP
jgi:hypothetical protein